MNRQRKTSILGPMLAAALICFSVTMTHPLIGAPVNYSQGIISGENDILNPGTLLVATDFGAGVPGVTVNGLAFGPDSSTGLNGFVHGSPADFSNQFPSGSPLDQLLSELVFQDIGLGNSSLTLSGLTPGTDYLLQVFLSNVVNATAKSSRITIQGQAYDIANFGDNANYIRAYFNASGSSEVVQFGNGSPVEPDRMVMNAFALTTVPEPASLTIFGLGLAALAWNRRRV